MKTITLSDEAYAELLRALNGDTQPTPAPTPTPMPGKESIIFVPWEIRAGTYSTTVDPTEVVTFEFTPQDTNRKLASFVISPADGNAYYETEMCLSSTPGGFDGVVVRGQGGRLYFTCGGFPQDRYGRTDVRYPDLRPGFNSFVNVRMRDPNRSAKINYALMPA